VRVDDALAVERAVALTADHVAQLRAREVQPKEAFTLADSRGRWFRAALRGASDAGGEAWVYEELPGSPESPCSIVLVCAVLARQRMLTVVQKATELGAVRIVPVWSDHSVQPPDIAKEKPWSWQNQALRAARQCRRAVVPEVAPIVPLADALAPVVLGEGTHLVALDHGGAHEPEWTFPSGSASVALAVGPEGGWSESERALLRSRKAHVLSLGVRVLRAETAAYVGLALLQHRFGDLR
jgi:16S rRNA (uracil1498-N3)-methyltransferase